MGRHRVWAYATSANIPGRRELNDVPYGHFSRVSLFAQKLCHLEARAEMTENCHRSGIVFAVWDIDVFDIFFCSACSTVRWLKKGKTYYLSVLLLA